MIFFNFYFYSSHFNTTQSFSWMGQLGFFSYKHRTNPLQASSFILFHFPSIFIFLLNNCIGKITSNQPINLPRQKKGPKGQEKPLRFRTDKTHIYYLDLGKPAFFFFFPFVFFFIISHFLIGIGKERKQGEERSFLFFFLTVIFGGGGNTRPRRAAAITPFFF